MWCVAGWNHRSRSTPSHSWSFLYRHAGHTSEWFISAMRYNQRQFQWICVFFLAIFSHQWTQAFQFHIHIIFSRFFAIVSFLLWFFIIIIIIKCIIYVKHILLFENRFDSIKMVMHMATTIFISIRERERNSTISRLEHGRNRNVLFIYVFT